MTGRARATGGGCAAGGRFAPRLAGMRNVNPPSERLYGVMQALLRAYAQQRTAPSAPPRGVVEEQDAVDAVVNLAAVLDKNLRDGRLSENSAAHMAALLMLIRD